MGFLERLILVCVSSVVTAELLVLREDGTIRPSSDETYCVRRKFSKSQVGHTVRIGKCAKKSSKNFRKFQWVYDEKKNQLQSKTVGWEKPFCWSITTFHPTKKTKTIQLNNCKPKTVNQKFVFINGRIHLKKKKDMCVGIETSNGNVGRAVLTIRKCYATSFAKVAEREKRMGPKHNHNKKIFSVNGDYKGQKNPRPVIGVITQECRSSTGAKIFVNHCHRDKKPDQYGYVSSAYVKWIESSGALVHIIGINTSNATLTDLMMNHLSGVVIPGSGSSTHKPKMQKLAYHAVDLIRQRVANIPVFGICMGMQIIAKVFTCPMENKFKRCAKGTVCNCKNLMGTHGTKNIALSMKLRHTGTSRMLANLKKQPQTKDFILNYPSTMNAHGYGFSRKKIYGSGLKIVGTSRDPLSRRTFVAAIEHKDPSIPVYGIQWHPEKSNFEFNRKQPERIDFVHTFEAVNVAQYFGNFLVEQARRHKNRYTLEDGELAYSMNAFREYGRYHLSNYFA